MARLAVQTTTTTSYYCCRKNKRYFESIYEGSVSEEDYLHNRRTAYNADNELTSAWKGMRLEPKDSNNFKKVPLT